ncbi:Adenosylcobinamide kinase [Sphingomonas sp. RIT328]|nr:Adenosylcobinamide kinase [Sphingomonas sp. RIT328]
MIAAKTLFLGGARSGKSRLAQAAAERSAGPLHYLATAEAHDDEMAERIARHRADRDDRWRTIDCPVALPQAIAAIHEGAILVDCLTLWLSNVMLGGHDLAAQGEALCAALAATRRPVFVVSNEVGLGIVPDHPLGRAFRDAAGRLHQQVAAVMHDVYFVVAGRVLPLQPFPHDTAAPGDLAK